MLLSVPVILAAQGVSYLQLRTADGMLEGVVSSDGKVRTFKGIPYAAAPVGALRWKPPQPAVPWTGVRKASDYGPRAMQGRIYDDMIFHDDGPSEDCLYLNLWMPAKPSTDKLPVMVWIHGGGFAAGSSSEPRQDGGNLSKKDVMVVSMNYRMGVFGFFAHPELAKESEHGASGNYGLLDILAALQWVKRNIATFGGDPENVTIFGQSAGSSSVSALMASPLGRGLFQRAIGESGSTLNPVRPLASRAQAEQAGAKFAEEAFGPSSLQQLRALSAQQLLEAALKVPPETFRLDVDGWLLPESTTNIFAAGRQNHVSLIAGWNTDEGNYRSFFSEDEPTLANYVARARIKFGENAEAFLKAYAATTDMEAKHSARDFASDQPRGYGIWNWLNLHRQTGNTPVWRFKFEQTLPPAPEAKPGAEAVAPHSAEIEFVFRVLSSRHLPWRPEDHAVSELMADYWTNFAKTGNPNGPGLPLWPAYDASTGDQVMHIKTQSVSAPDAQRARYEFIERVNPAG